MAEDTEPPESGDGSPTTASADVVLRLPDELRSAFKDPLGPVETDPEALLADVSGALVAVGDVVTYHLLSAGRRPDLAVIDGKTERENVDQEIREALDFGGETVPNPPAALSAELLTALREGLATDERTTIVVDGEEDLVTLPAVLAVPDGTSIVYGQPGVGMVHVRVDTAVRERCRRLFDQLDGDRDRARTILDL